MPNTNTNASKIILWGPPAFDWLNVSHGGDEAPPARQSPAPQETVYLTAQRGGIQLLYDLLKEMFKGSMPLDAPKAWHDAHDDEQLPPSPLSTKYRHTWSQWQRCGKPPAYRMTSMGVTTCEPGNLKPTPPIEPSTQSHSQHAAMCLLIIDYPGYSADSADSIRWLNDDVVRNNNVSDILVRLDWRTWRGPATSGKAPTSPSSTGPPAHLKDSCFGAHLAQADRQGVRAITTIVTPVRSLRSSDVRVGASLSWERIFDDIVQAATSYFDGLFKRIIVTIGLCGAVIIEKPTGHTQSTRLVFDHRRQEQDFEKDHNGKVLGLSTCMMAGLATSWAEARPGTAVEETESWAKAARVGLAMMRRLSNIGYQPTSKPATRQVLAFPFSDIRDAYYEASHYYERQQHHEEELRSSSAGQLSMSKERHESIDPEPRAGELGNAKNDKPPSPEPDKYKPQNPDPESFGGLRIFPRNPSYARRRDAGSWTILEEDNSKGGNPASEEAFLQVAKQIVHSGPAAVEAAFPVESVQNWYSADREEIEGVRSVRNAMRQYLDDKGPKPLSIAVFGPPGAGKSFVVRQIARDLDVKQECELTFNLSQYESPRELARAFHRARDVVLKGGIPLVFWDEFDSPLGNQPLGWLRYFLSPMQDGEFLEEGVVHPVGSGIYIFAGGTADSFRKFVGKPTDPNDVTTGDDHGDGTKRPDFISRLRAYIDVKGPNKTESREDTGRISPGSMQRIDNSYIIRRAFLLRSQIELHSKLPKVKGQYIVDPGVLEAFLLTAWYRHGARSLENIVLLSDFRGKTKYELSSLPPEHLLGMHVDVADFMSYVLRRRIES